MTRGPLTRPRPHRPRPCVAALAADGGDALVLPATAYAEVLVGPMRRGAGPLGRVEPFVAELGMKIEPVTAAIARRAAALRARHTTVRLPDALVRATGDLLQAHRVLTADRSWAKLSRRVRII